MHASVRACVCVCVCVCVCTLFVLRIPCIVNCIECFYVNNEPESKFLYIETIKLYCIVLYCIVTPKIRIVFCSNK